MSNIVIGKETYFAFRHLDSKRDKNNILDLLVAFVLALLFDL